ncbi:hypothetical protein J4E85_002844 [Alternaria conjuncta]|uniref:uncharacterized protein n=1 Tax=Alternaria conjuncta TaxID=181017 RepID=UPI00221FC240|nr:uncharacterized protein J4E85_002844 [Alternaria conjuncta]KAI4932446.1 hypothetical protein J4E85_002844 [Alternaria conjuncta]
MAEVCAILGGVGSIFSIVNGISKVVGTISDLQTKWGEADLTLLSLASQLIALRAASTKIQEWIDQDLQDTHHQLVMDLDVSVSCCKLLMTEIESFFSDIAQLTEKPLDLRDKFKVVFGSYGPESVQKLIEHQTSSLTLLLTACNCKTLSEQQRILGTNKTRKVLDRAKADSISLYVHRDSASLTSKMTDNMSKISRVFEFDSNIFSTGVYERAFRGSVRDLLKRRQQTLRSHPIASSAVEPTPTPGSLQSICFLGPDQIGMDLLIDTIQTDQHHLHDEWALHQWELRKLFLSLVITIVRTRSDHCDEEDAGIVMRFMRTEEYLERYSELHSVSHKALGACTRIWNDAVQLAQDPHVRNAYRERVEFGKMVFWVQIIPDRGLSVTSGNYAARSAQPGLRIFSEGQEWLSRTLLSSFQLAMLVQ